MVQIQQREKWDCNKSFGAKDKFHINVKLFKCWLYLFKALVFQILFWINTITYFGHIFSTSFDLVSRIFSEAEDTVFL